MISKAVENLFERSEKQIIWSQSILLTFINLNAGFFHHRTNNILQKEANAYLKK